MSAVWMIPERLHLQQSSRPLSDQTLDEVIRLALRDLEAHNEVIKDENRWSRFVAGSFTEADCRLQRRALFRIDHCSNSAVVSVTSRNGRRCA